MGRVRLGIELSVLYAVSIGPLAPWLLPRFTLKPKDAPVPTPAE